MSSSSNPSSTSEFASALDPITSATSNSPSTMPQEAGDSSLAAVSGASADPKEAITDKVADGTAGVQRTEGIEKGEAQEEADKLYEERMEEEYAKREGGA